jgi:sugar phosphate isomerase/epimerase
MARLSRRTFLAGTTMAAVAAARAAAATGRTEADGPRTGAGVCTHSYAIRPRNERQKKVDPAARLTDPLVFLRHCARLGAGGVQIGLGIRDAAYVKALRASAEAWGTFIQGIAGLPFEEKDADRFDAELRTACEAGASVVRTVMMPGRRYEQFKTLEEFRTFAARGRRGLERAEPIARRHGVHLALENHKDQRIEERLAVLEAIGSEHVGMCVDTANSIALLEDPMAVVRAYAPWARSVHLKDHRVHPRADGFLAADVPLGRGFLDLRQMVGALKKARPGLRFTIEMHTRDPLRVPCLTEGYWATMPDVPATVLARAMAWVREHAAEEPLLEVSRLPLAEQIALEEANVRASLAYCREPLGL